MALKTRSGLYQVRQVGLLSLTLHPFFDRNALNFVMPLSSRTRSQYAGGLTSALFWVGRSRPCGRRRPIARTA